MNFLSRLFKSTAKPRPAPRRVVARGLALERLEERWAPALVVLGLGTDAAQLVDDDTGKTANSVEIIDDLSTQTTYYKVNGGPEAQLGMTGKLVNSLLIDMGVGNDKVVFSVRGSGAWASSVDRSIDMGAGNDTLLISGPGNAGGFALQYSIDGAGGGNDTYSVVGAVSNTWLFYVGISDETSGNDKYTFDVSATNAQVSLNFFDLAGADSYTFKTGALTSNGRLDAWGADSGAGKNSFKTSHYGDVTSGRYDLAFDFSGATGGNSFSFGGNVQVFNSDYSIDITGGAGVDKVTIDDNIVTGASANATYLLGLGGANDSVTVKLDGNPKSSLPALADRAVQHFGVNLGEGNNKFTATFGKSYTINNTQTGSGVVGLSIDVIGGTGNDKMSVAASSKSQVTLAGNAPWLWVQFFPGAGDDTLSVNFGKLIGNATSGKPGLATVLIDASSGADKVTLSGTLFSAAYTTLALNVNLGDDLVKDSFTSNLKTVGTSGFDISDLSSVTAYTGDKLTAKYKFYGLPFTDFVDVFYL